MSFETSAKTPEAREFVVGARPLLLSLLAVDLVLILLNIANILVTGGVKNVIFLGIESNFPTWWSSMKFGLAGLSFAAVALRNWFCSSSVFGISLVALIFLGLSVDEIATVHERTGMLIDLSTRRESLFHYTGVWFLAVGIPVVFVVMAILWQFRSLLGVVPDTTLRLFCGFVTLFTGALLVEGVTNFILPPDMVEERRAFVPYLFTVVTEEGLEMIGASILFWAGILFLLRHPRMDGVIHAFMRQG